MHKERLSISNGLFSHELNATTTTFSHYQVSSEGNTEGIFVLFCWDLKYFNLVFEMMKALASWDFNHGPVSSTDSLVPPTSNVNVHFADE